jgi:hypothetical protein
MRGLGSNSGHRMDSFCLATDWPGPLAAIVNFLSRRLNSPRFVISEARSKESNELALRAQPPGTFGETNQHRIRQFIDNASSVDPTGAFFTASCPSSVVGAG